MRLTLPEYCLVCLIGPSGSGKSIFAAQHFLPTEVISSDACRGLVCDDENSLEASSDAFELVRFIASKRLANRRLTVIDATSVKREDRQPIVALAKQYHALPVALVFNMPEGLCHERNRERPDRDFGRHVVRNQAQQLRRSLKRLRKEGFRYVYVFTSPEEVASAEIERQRLWTDRRDEHGPFDIVGDVHGCFDELPGAPRQFGLLGCLEGRGRRGRRLRGSPSRRTQGSISRRLGRPWPPDTRGPAPGYGHDRG
jgi:protein phosphatase